jgi:hypothetical protein
VLSRGTHLLRIHTFAPISAAVFLLRRSEPVPGNRRCASDAVTDGNPVAVGTEQRVREMAGTDDRRQHLGRHLEPLPTVSDLVVHTGLARLVANIAVSAFSSAGAIVAAARRAGWAGCRRRGRVAHLRQQAPACWIVVPCAARER